LMDWLGVGESCRVWSGFDDDLADGAAGFEQLVRGSHARHGEA